MNRNLALCARRRDLLDELRAELLAAYPGISVATRELDVNDHQRVFPVFGELSAELGGLDRIILNAGSRQGRPLGTGSFDLNKRTAETNFVAVVAQCEAGMALLRAGAGGHLVLISSMSALRGFPGNLTVYAASKAGVLTLAEGLRAEVLGSAIRVSAILPGYIRTEATAALPAGRLMTDTERGCRLLARAIEQEPVRASVPRWPWSMLGIGMRVMPIRVVRRFGGTAQLARES